MASNLDRDFTVRAGDYSDCADAHIVVMAAGKSRLPGQTRLDMFDDSIKMMNTIVGPLKESGFHGILISISKSGIQHRNISGFSKTPQNVI